MKRRQFITLLGGAAVAWPLAARGQQSALPVIGFLSTRAPDDIPQLVAAFRGGLAEHGYVEGRSLRIEYRSADGRYERLPALAADLVSRPIAVLVAVGGDPAGLAARRATSTIPIVFAIGSDPVKLGLVASYKRPGGHITGVNILTNTLGPKRLGLLHELAPQATTLGVLLNPSNPTTEQQLKDFQDAASSIGLQPRVLRASSDREIETAFELVAQDRISALAVGADPFFNSRRHKLVALAARHTVPAIYQFREYAEAGGLMSYGIDLAEMYRHIGGYTARILRGTSPADLPVLEPTKFEFVINSRLGDRMKRRQFITLLGGAAAAWPLAAHAQQGERVRRIGVITGGDTPDDPDMQARLAAFLEVLRQLGWREGQNLRVDYRWPVGDPDRIRRHAAELVELAPDVILTTGTVTMTPLLQATRTIPIVFVSVADPVGAGFVDSLARPGGNATGFMQFEYSLSGKWLELLKEIAPGLVRAAVLRDPAISSGPGQFGAIQSVAASIGVELSPVNMREPSEMDRALGAFARSGNGGMIVTSSGLAAVHRELIITLAARYKLPAVYFRRYFVARGGLLSYGYDLTDMTRRAAQYVDRILRGEKPGDLPVQAPNKYELALNLKTAKALGLAMPPTLLARADEVIE